MSSPDLEKQNLHHNADADDSSSPILESLDGGDEKFAGKRQHQLETQGGFVPGHSRSPTRDRIPLQPTRSCLTCLSDEGVPVRGSVSRGSGEVAKYEVGWDGDNDPLSPQNMHAARKWLITWIMALCSMCVTCTSSLYTMTYDQLDREFGSPRIVATLGLSLFVFGLGLSPMVLGPLSEFFGRRPIYIGAFVFFTIWLVPCAVARNIQTLLIARFFNGLSGSAFLSVAGGTIGDMFTSEELQAPMMIYTASPFIGPGLGPIIGGFVNYYLDWRWSFYILLIWSGLMLAAIVLLIPETYSPVVSCFISPMSPSQADLS